MPSTRSADAPSGRRGRPQVTSRDEVAQVALRIARAEGLDGVTVRRIAEELGHAPMTVYRITSTKTEVHQLMVETALLSLAFEEHPELDWRDQLFEGLMAMYRLLRDNPAIIELLAGPTPVFGEGLDRMREMVFAPLTQAIDDRQHAIDVFNVISSYLLGVATAEVARSRRSSELEEHLAQAGPSVRQWLEPLPEETIATGLRVLIRQYVG